MNESYDNELHTEYHPGHDYDELFNVKYLRSRDTGSLIPYILLKCILALVSRVGFILIQIGSVPVENVYTIVVYNLLEIAVGILFYGLVGNIIAFGPDSVSGWISLSKWKWDDVSSMTQDLDGALIGICSVLVATAQISSFLVGRTTLAGGMILTGVYSGVLQPFLLHWIWHERGWMRHSTFLTLYVSVQDRGGALAIHIPSVVIGTTGSIFLGRRILKLSDVDALSFGTENVVTTLIGYLLIIFNYIVFALPTYELDNDSSALVLVNSLLAIGAGVFIVTVLQRMIFRDTSRHRRIIRSVQGGIASLITIAPGVNLYYPSVTIITSLIASIIFFFFAEILQNTALEDPCSLISSHLVCGFIGVLLCPLIAQKDNLGNTVRIETLGVHVLWQFICVCVVIGISIIAALFFLLLLKICRVLRSDVEITNHKRASVLRHALPKRGYLGRLFNVNTTTGYVEPGYWKSYSEAEAIPKTNKSTDLTSVSMGDGDKIRKKV